MNIRFQPNDFSREFFEIIDIYIKTRGITQVDLADKMCKSKGWWRVHVHYAKPLNARTINKLCDVLEITRYDRARLHWLAACGLGYDVGIA